jgi:general secretion pathway protein G
MIPVDPMTRSAETWIEVREVPTLEDPMIMDIPGVVDVKSGSEKNSPIDDSPYGSW